MSLNKCGMDGKKMQTKKQKIHLTPFKTGSKADRSLCVSFISHSEAVAGNNNFKVTLIIRKHAVKCPW